MDEQKQVDEWDRDIQAVSQHLRKLKGIAPLTAAEAEKAYDEAEPVPISAERIKEIVAFVTQEQPTIPPPA